MAKKKSRWYYKKDGAKHGPFRTREIKRLVREGSIDADDVLWKRGLPHPVRAGDIPQLFRTGSTPATRRRLIHVLQATGLLLLMSLLLSPSGDLVNRYGEGMRVASGIASGFSLVASLATLVVGLGTIGSTFETVRVGAPIRLDDEQDRMAQSLWRLIRPADRRTDKPSDAAGGRRTSGLLRWPRWKLPAGRFLPTLVDGENRAGLFAAGIGIVAAGLFYLGQTRETFPYPVERVSGLVSYRDGSLLPADVLQLTFYPQAAPLNSRTHPRAGSALVDRKTGRFEAATTFRPSDGLIRGKHKVTIHLPGRLPLPPEIAGAEYGDSSRTPLEIDTAVPPLAIVIEKPDEPPATPAP